MAVQLVEESIELGVCLQYQRVRPGPITAGGSRFGAGEVDESIDILVSRQQTERQRKKQTGPAVDS